MGIFLPRNINYKEKPQQYGDFSFAQSSLFENADRIGIDPDRIALAMPMWNLDKHVDYSKAEFLPININIGFDKNAYLFSSSNTGIILGNSYEINNYPQGLTIFSTAKAYISGMKKWGKIICQNYQEYPTWSNPYIVFSVSRYSDTNTFQSFLFYTGSSSNSSSGVEIPDKQIFSVTITHDNINSKLFVNGDEKYSYLNSGMIQVPNNRNLFIGREGRSTPIEYWNGNIFQILMIKYALSPDQIAFLSDNPYYLWQPRNKRTWFIPVDATGGNIFQVSCSDAFSFNDVSTRTAIFSVMANETLSLSDAPDNVGNFLSSALSQILMTDQTSTRLITLGNVADSISISDTASVLSSITGLVSDSVMLFDKSSSTGIFQGNATDSITFADAVVNSLLLQGVVNEILTLSDSASLGSFLQGIISDNISFSDSAVNTATLNSAIQENLTLSDSAVNILNTFASASDTINLSDMSAWGAFKQALAISGFNLTDSATNNLLTFAQAADSITFNDNAHMNVTFNVEVKDAVSFAETVSKIAIFQAAVSDSVNFSATAMEVSQLPNGKVSVSFNMKVPGVNVGMKTPGVGINIKTAIITFNLK